MKKFNNNSSGNVLFLILIAVALFAALSYAVTGSSRTGENGISKDKAKLYASRIVQLASQVEQATTRLELLGTPIYRQDFSDSTAPIENIANTNCTNDSCKIFSVAGGGVAPIIDWPEEARDVNNPNKFKMSVTTVQAIDVGSTLPDVIFLFVGISDEICDEINTKLNGTTSKIENFGGTHILIEGNLSAVPDTGTALFGNEDAQYKGRISFCAKHNNGNYYAHVLKAR